MESLRARYRAPIHAFLRARGVPENDADDVVQEVFLQVSRSGFLESAKPELGRFRTLLLRVALNVRATELRKKYARKRGAGRPVFPIEEAADTPVSAGDESQFNRE